MISNIDISNITSDDITLAIVGYVVVFSALVVLYIVFTSLSKAMNRSASRRLREKGKNFKEDEISVTGEVNAAISMALFLYFNEMHDEESGNLTIKNISRRYSPWSSKIYGVMSNQIQK
jgi:Na+-transporting methylmalonyl-CoA/oxaloacetate decarboxylase gamma subunit